MSQFSVDCLFEKIAIDVSGHFGDVQITNEIIQFL